MSRHSPEMQEVHLSRAIRALIRVCQISEQDEISYPERLGSMEMEAAIALASLGHPEWEQRKLNSLQAMIMALNGDTAANLVAQNCPQSEGL